ncbi:MAG: beta-lactamase family protein, partial [Candidatus Hydrogenedentes bacterium]|nr:beta-lactamase family protein [Candidatus Hydrogenedentota bacterium]
MKAFQQALDKAVKDAKAPGAVAFVGHRDKTLFHGISGYRAIVPERQAVKKDTLYDLASLTKVLCTTTAILLLNERGLLDLDQPVSEIIPVPAFSKFTILHLLTHTSGLPGYKVWYKELKGLDAYVKRIGTMELGWKPGTRRNYSDLGFMLLAKVVEMVGRDSLDAFAQANIFKPLKMKNTGFKPPKKRWKDCAATEKCAWRKRVMQGEVHDDNAYAIGGVSGHAGLFAPAEAIANVCRAMID